MKAQGERRKEKGTRRKAQGARGVRGEEPKNGLCANGTIYVSEGWNPGKMENGSAVLRGGSTLICALKGQFMLAQSETLGMGQDPAHRLL